MDVEDLRQFNDNIETLIKLRGAKAKASLPSEEISRKNARRSIVLKRPVEAGKILKVNDLTYKRPGTGISPEFWDQVIGCKTLKSLSEDQILEWTDIE